MSLYRQFQTNQSLEVNGIDLEYGTNSKGQPIRIKIARSGGANKRFARALEVATRPYKRQIVNDRLDAELATTITRKVYAETVVLGWTGVEDKAGVEIPFSVAACINLFNDLPDLFEDIATQAARLAAFREDLAEADAKN